MYKQMVAGLLSGTILATMPLTLPGMGPQGDAQAYAAEGSAAGNAQSVQLSAQLVRVFQAYKESGDGTLDPKLVTELLQQKEQLLPYLLAGLTLADNRLALHKDTEYDSYYEWRFWLKLAEQLPNAQTKAALLGWTTEKNRLIPDTYLLEDTFEQVFKREDEQLVEQALGNASASGAEVILTFLEKRHHLDEQKLRQYADVYRGKPQLSAIISKLGHVKNGLETLKTLYVSKEITEEQRQDILDAMLYKGDKSREDLAWLRQLASDATTSLQVEQEIDEALVYQHGDIAAAKRLHDSGMAHGFAFSLSGITEKFIAEQFPKGKLQQGITEYEAIRGKSYFSLDEDSFWANGRDFSHPEKAVSQWLSFIQKYPNHPALDDAAYRLARCYQLLGQYERALYWFNQAQITGDRDLGYDASGQYLYVLDVDLTAKGLAELDTTKLPAWTKEWVDYTLAVEYLRQHEYAKGAKALETFIATYKDQEQQPFDHEEEAGEYYSWNEDYPFWQKVEEQRALAAKLANMAVEVEQATGAVKAKRQYALAAEISRNPLLYYNHLWRDQRQSFFSFGQIKYMDYHEELDRYIARFNHLFQARALFAGIDLQEADQETGAKTLFSLMLMNSKLIDYGEEVAYHQSKTLLGAEMLKEGKELRKRYPTSELADDALLLMYHYTRDQSLLDELLRDYPNSDKAAEAKQILQDKESEEKPAYVYDRLESYPPVQRLSEQDWRLPQQVQTWVKEHEGKTGKYLLKDGEWQYAYLVPAAGETATISLRTSLSQSMFQYYTSTTSDDAASGKRTASLVRVPYRYVQHAPVVWETPSQ